MPPTHRSTLPTGDFQVRDSKTAAAIILCGNAKEASCGCTSCGATNATITVGSTAVGDRAKKAGGTEALAARGAILRRGGAGVEVEIAVAGLVASRWLWQLRLFNCTRVTHAQLSCRLSTPHSVINPNPSTHRITFLSLYH